jgi:hypothetical protein
MVAEIDFVREDCPLDDLLIIETIKRIRHGALRLAVNGLWSPAEEYEQVAKWLEELLEYRKGRRADDGRE